MGAMWLTSIDPTTSGYLAPLPNNSKLSNFTQHLSEPFSLMNSNDRDGWPLVACPHWLSWLYPSSSSNNL